MRSGPFHPVVLLPEDAELLDLSGALPEPGNPWTIGRYDEARGIYTQALFAGGRCVHMGIDLGVRPGWPSTLLWTQRLSFRTTTPPPATTAPR